MKPSTGNTLGRVDRAITRLVLTQPFYATLAMRLHVSESTEVPTAATDGKRLLINPAFAADLDDAQLRTVIAHEVMHCAHGHVWRKPAEATPRKWNIAADYETNLELEAANEAAQRRGEPTPFPAPPSGWLCDAQYRDTAAEIIHRRLVEVEEQDGDGSGKGEGDGDDPGGCGGVLPPPPGEDPKQMAGEWERAVVQAAAACQGDTPAGIRRLVERLTSARTDWRAVLRDYLRDLAADDWSWQRPSRRWSADGDIIMPSLYNEGAGRVVFAVDTSGSISDDILTGFIAEAQWCLDELKPTKLTVCACDTVIHRWDEFATGDTIAGEWPGGGGTDFRPVFDRLAESEDTPHVLVYLTDCYGEFPEQEPGYPVIWACWPGATRNPWGSRIDIQQ